MKQLSMVFALASLALEPEANAQQWQPGIPGIRDVEQRRAERDQVLRSVGPQAGPFTRKHGDAGVLALRKCGAETGRKLVDLDEKGGLDRLPRPEAILEIIAQTGDVVALWIIDQSVALADPDMFDAFCREPRDFAYGLKSLEKAGAELRKTRNANSQAWTNFLPPGWDWKAIFIGGAIIVVVFMVYRSRGQKAHQP